MNAVVIVLGILLIVVIGVLGLLALREPGGHLRSIVTAVGLAWTLEVSNQKGKDSEDDGKADDDSDLPLGAGAHDSGPEDGSADAPRADPVHKDEGGKLQHLVKQLTTALFGNLWRGLRTAAGAVIIAWAVHEFGPSDAPVHQTPSTLQGEKRATSPAIPHYGATGIGFVAPQRPANLTPPRVFGVPKAGETIGCSYGLWTGDPVPTLGVQWSRDYVRMRDAERETYEVKADDRGHVLRCRVTATNAAGARSSISAGVTVPIAGPTETSTRGTQASPPYFSTTPSTTPPSLPATKPKSPQGKTKAEESVVINDWSG